MRGKEGQAGRDASQAAARPVKAARLHHTNIVPIFEGRPGGCTVCFYATQFILGQGLDVVIEDLAPDAPGGRVPTSMPANPPRLAGSLLSGSPQGCLEGNASEAEGSSAVLSGADLQYYFRSVAGRPSRAMKCWATPTSAGSIIHRDAAEQLAGHDRSDRIS